MSISPATVLDIAALHQRGYALNRIARKTQVPLRVVAEVLGTRSVAPTRKPNVTRAPSSTPKPSRRISHRVTLVSFERVAPYLDQCLPE